MSVDLLVAWQLPTVILAVHTSVLALVNVPVRTIVPGMPIALLAAPEYLIVLPLIFAGSVAVIEIPSAHLPGLTVSVAVLPFLATVANSSPGVRIVPVIPSYAANPWHIPAVENIATATSALDGALGAGSRVNGAGIWWWYGFFDNKPHYNASADRAAWQSTTTLLAFTP